MNPYPVKGQNLTSRDKFPCSSFPNGICPRKNPVPGRALDYPRDKDGKVITMWNLIPRKLMPPTRTVRYCCECLKETGGKGRVVVTGVRWDESVRRKNTRGLAMRCGEEGKHESI